jgi:protein-tyrosine phosphatase
MGAVRVEREHHDVWLIDSDAADVNPNLDFVLDDTAATIEQWRSEGARVFVHGVTGVSRTPTVAAAYLARRLGISGLDALQRVQQMMPNGRPNRAFRSALERIRARDD